MGIESLFEEAIRIYRHADLVTGRWDQDGELPNLRTNKQLVTQAQRELRDLKRRLAEEEREVRLSHQELRGKIAGQGQVIGMFANSKTRGAMSRGRASARQSLAKKEASALQPYRTAKAEVDRQLNNLQTRKEAIAAKLETSKSDSRKSRSRPPDLSARAATPRAPGPPPPPLSPPSWAADPLGRHQLRYWDGAQWSEHVSDDGNQSEDSIES